MPNRILKESIRTSRSVNNLSDFEFRVWAYLITYVDDYGRGSADPELLRGLCFPRRKGITEQQIAKAISNLAMSGMVILYVVDGESFLAFPNWEKHQQIRSKKSRFPAPEEGEMQSDINCNQMISDDSKCPRNPIQSNTNPNPNPNTNTNSREERAVSTRKYGIYKNVLLSGEDLAKLQEEFPVDWGTRIDRLSEYIASSGKSYKNHLATIRAWARKDNTPPANVAKNQLLGYADGVRKADDEEIAAMRRMLDDT